MDSEPEIGRGYADMTMIIRPDMRRFEIFDVLLEFKFLTLGDLGLSGEQARELTDDQARQLPPVVWALAEGTAQAERYRGDLKRKYGNLRLTSFVVVAIGFERLVWDRVE